MLHATAYVAVATGAFVLAWLFVRRLATYWTFFHTGNAGSTGLFLYYIVIPLSVAVALAVGLVTAHAVLQDDESRGAAICRALGAVLLLFAALFGVELWRTREVREEWAEPPGTFVDYLREYPW